MTEPHQMRVTMNGTPVLDIIWIETESGAYDFHRVWHQPHDIIHRELLITVRDYLKNLGWTVPEPPADLDWVRRFVKPPVRK